VSHKESAFHVANRLEVNSVHLANYVKTHLSLTDDVSRTVFDWFFRVHFEVVPGIKERLLEAIRNQTTAWEQIADQRKT
jgi:hypothetical protein